MLLLFAVTVFQLVHIKGGTPAKSEDARSLLYQVSLFQVELLSNFLQGAVRSGKTGGHLDALRNAAFSVSYTHERLALAHGEGRVPPLESAAAIMQYVTGLQIGGERSFKKEEAAAVKAASDRMLRIYETYGLLLTKNGEVAASQAKRLKELDQELAAYIKQQLLQ